MDPDTIARIQYDEFEMGRRNVAAIEQGISQEISFIIHHIDNKKAGAQSRADAMTNEVIVLNYTTTRYYIGDGPQAGWHVTPYEKCSRLSILNKGGLVAFNASMAQSYDAYRGIPSGYVWYARPTDGSIWYGQVRITDIAPAIFVAKCNATTGIAELKWSSLHADGTPIAVK
jgi:hypothetical protein